MLILNKILQQGKSVRLALGAGGPHTGYRALLLWPGTVTAEVGGGNVKYHTYLGVNEARAYSHLYFTQLASGSNYGGQTAVIAVIYYLIEFFLRPGSAGLFPEIIQYQ